MRRPACLVLLLAVGGGLGCGRGTAILALQRSLVHQFHTDAISVTVSTGADLAVLFTSSDAAVMAGPDRPAFARQVAEYVRDHYAGYAALSRIDVVFTRTAQRDSYGFTTTELGSSRETGDVAVPDR